jgi:uncharacterized integral membrane protein
MVMRKFLTGLVLIPLALIFVVFAVANRHWVTVSFDPFNSADPSVAVTLPLFVVIIVVAILHEADARQARADLAAMRTSSMTPARYGLPRLAAPPQGRGYGPGGRDKQGATL